MQNQSSGRRNGHQTIRAARPSQGPEDRFQQELEEYFREVANETRDARMAENVSTLGHSDQLSARTVKRRML